MRSPFYTRAAVVLACVATLVSGVLGLGNGMVVCTDVHGCVAIEPAHDRHLDCHTTEHDDAGGGHDGERPDPAHEPSPCSDETSGTAAVKRTSAAGGDAARLALELSPLPPVLAPAVSSPERGLPATAALFGSPPGCAHPELARLDTVVLLV